MMPFGCISTKNHHNHLPIACPCGILGIHIITLNILIPDDWLDHAFPPHNLKCIVAKSFTVKQLQLYCTTGSHATVNWLIWTDNWISFTAFPGDSYRIIHKLYFVCQAQKLVSFIIPSLYDPYHRQQYWTQLKSNLIRACVQVNFSVQEENKICHGIIWNYSEIPVQELVKQYNIGQLFYYKNNYSLLVFGFHGG